MYRLAAGIFCPHLKWAETIGEDVLRIAKEGMKPSQTGVGEVKDVRCLIAIRGEVRPGQEDKEFGVV
jgi:hypothetical protein